MNYADQMHDLILAAYTNLDQKMRDAGRIIAPGAAVEMKFDESTNSFVMECDTIPDPRLA